MRIRLAILALVLLPVVHVSAQAPFVRGDGNADGRQDISDPIRIIDTLFLGGAPLPCEDAADVNDDGSLSVADVISSLMHIFGYGPPPPLPFPLCGPDPTFDLLGCLGYPPCGTAFSALPLEAPPARPPGSACSSVARCGAAGCAGPEDPIPTVYLQSREVHLEATDLVIAGRGLDFRWVRKYRSRYGPDTEAGYGWDFSYNIAIELSGPDVVLHDGHSRRDVLTLQADGTYGVDELFRSLELDPTGTSVLTFPDGGTWCFGPFDGNPEAGKIQSIRDRNGNTLSFAYDGNGRLCEVIDTLGRSIAVSYDGTGQLESVTDFTGRTVFYSYYDGVEPGGNLGDLKSVASPAVTGTPTGNDFPNGRITTYTYTTGFLDERLNHNLVSATDARGQTWLLNTYTPVTDPAVPGFDQVERVVWGDPGDVIDLTTVPVTPTPLNGFAVIRVTLNDRVGNVSEHLFDADRRCVLVREFTGRADPDLPTIVPGTNPPVGPLRSDDPPFFETRYAYNVDSLITEITRPNGNVIQKVHELALDPAAPRRARGNLRQLTRLPGSHSPAGDQPQIVETFQYAPGVGGCCGTSFVTVHVDGRGGVTTHTYDGSGNRIHTDHPIPGVVEDWEYDDYGQVTKWIHPDDGSGYRREDSYEYYGVSDGDAYGYRKSTTKDVNGFGLVTTFEVDAVGNRTRIIDARGHDTLYTYNQLDELVREESRELTAGSGDRYGVDQIYDANGNLIEIITEHVASSCIPAAVSSYSTVHEFDTLNLVTRIERQVDATSSAETLFEYDENRNLTLTTLGEAANGSQPTNVRRHLYDERDLLYRQIRGEGDPDQATDQYDYDGNQNIRRLTVGLEDPTPRIYCFTHDGYDRRVTRIDPLCNRTDYHYDANGNLGGDQSPGIPNPFAKRVLGELVDDGNGGCSDCQEPGVTLHEVMNTYDALDRRITREVRHFDPQTGLAIGDGLSVTTWSYAPNSQVTSVTDDNGASTPIIYDTMRRRDVVVDARGNSRGFEYDANSNIVSVTEIEVSDVGAPDEIYVTTHAYDGMDRLITTTDPLGQTRDYGYDSRNNRDLVTDERGNVTCYQYDGLERLVSTRRQITDTGDGAGTIVGQIDVTQTWDDSSRLTSRTDGNGNSTSYGYDPLDRLVTVASADGTTRTLGYDGNDNLTDLVDANGTQVTNTYDALDRLASRSIVPGPGVSPSTTTESYSYDGLGRLVAGVNDDTSVTRAHDSLGRVISESVLVTAGVPSSGIVTRSHDGVGNVLTLGYPGGRTITFSHDVLRRPVEILESGSAIATYDYVGPRRVERREYPQLNPFNTLRSTYGYDGARRSSNVLHVKDPAGPGLVQAQYEHTWDPADSVLSRVDLVSGRPAANFSYDSLDRLVGSVRTPPGGGLGSIDYLLDSCGNRTEVIGGPTAGLYTMDPTVPRSDHQVNQYTMTPFGPWSYDDNGNLIDVNGVETLSHDYADRLVGSSDSGTGTSATYRYDVLGRIVEQDVNGVLRRFYYDGWRLIEERDLQGDTVATYVHGTRLDERVQMQRGGTDSFYLEDGIGNVVALASSLGVVVERYDYDDFGTPHFFMAGGIPMPSSAFGNDYLFTGRRFHPENGLYDYRARFYEPGAGRFVSRDPLGIWTDVDNLGNGVAYVGNNPWSRSDPFGEYQTPKFIDCSSSVEESIERALEQAESWIIAAYEHLDSLETARARRNDTLRTDYFGRYKKSWFNKAKKTVRKVRDAICNKKIKFKCLDSTGPCAVRPEGTPVAFRRGGFNFRVLLCDPFYRDGVADNAATIIHEVSHEKAGTDDVKWNGKPPYDDGEVRDLADREPKKARRNSYTFEHFSRNF